MYKKGDKIRILDKSKIHLGSNYVNGEIIVINSVDHRGNIFVVGKSRNVPYITVGEYSAIEKVEEEMNRQEALIEIIKGNTVVSRAGNEIYAENLDKECPKFIFVTTNGSDHQLNYGLDECNGPFTLKPKTHIIKLDDKEIEISEESYQAFKKQFTEE